MAHIHINLSKIQYNANVLRQLLATHHVQFTPVIKCIAGDPEIIRALNQLGFTHFADARLENIEKAKEVEAANTFTLIRAPHLQELKQVVINTTMSIQTELTTIRQLNDVAKSLDQKHSIMLMVDWKDAREGVLTYDIVDYVQEILHLSHICLRGIAFNFMCFNEIPPSESDIEMINRFVTSVEKETSYRFGIFSGGNSSMLPQMMYNDLGRVNDLRIGESLFRGVDTTSNVPIPSLYQDAITLETRIIEIKPRIEVNSGRQYLQAIVDIGKLDTEVKDIYPLGHDVDVLGATSDHLMIDLKNHDQYQVGDTITFRLGYNALAQTMYINQMEKIYQNDKAIDLLNKHFNVCELNKARK
ncbi:alanine racemase [Staphylococcus auricularis]|uniref:Alanine racemase n=1 Tax=Staphylococcus auricularis TaxID=29379 RepID=A0ABX5IER5_9STAP|nr:alanine racemase [Staphylococcus auricularis]MCE5038720.1 alanine racemase [Staphylococcus auricularis]MEB6570038.1 alanine racemase [Staphylococcus auricularis]PTH16731.1 alanine racemase [Staphylococcus auricularis]PTH24640.1 alanine racemase [Staphylococcus auricularis]